MLNEIIDLAMEFVDDTTMEMSEDTSIVADMELSSMEFFTFISKIETLFKVRITERELNQIATLGDLEKMIDKKKKH